MPKRKAEEKIHRYKQKIKKLQSEDNDGHKRRRIRVIYSDDSSEIEESDNIREVTSADVHVTTAVNNSPDVLVSARLSPINMIPESESLVPVPELAAVEQTIEETTQQQENLVEPELDPELLEALGIPSNVTPEYGEKISTALADLWLPILKKGLPKEEKEKILKNFLTPDNCRLLQAPKLNPEISAAIPDIVRNKDKILSYKQQQLGSGVTAISRGLDNLLKGDRKLAVANLSNACRILSDLHALYTQNRSKLVTSGLDKNFLHVIKETERDETLSGNNLSDKIKAAKAIEKQGHLIKKQHPKTSNASQSTSNTRQFTSENWTTPPRYTSHRGGRGASRKQLPRTRRYYPNSTQPQPRPAPTATKSRAPTTR